MLSNTILKEWRLILEQNFTAAQFVSVCCRDRHTPLLSQCSAKVFALALDSDPAQERFLSAPDTGDASLAYSKEKVSN